MSETLKIKLLDNPDNKQLKMKYIGAIEYATPKLGSDGKIKTGFDENAFEVMSIQDEKIRKKTQDSILKERKELERILNVDLSPNSNFWDGFYIPLKDEEISLDPTNAIDKVREKFLVANGYVAPSIDAIYDDEKYINCIFYIHRETEEVSKQAVKERLKDQATAKLYNLQEENPSKLVAVTEYVLNYNPGSPEACYVKLREFLDTSLESQRKKNIKLFLEAADKTPEELKTKIILDKAVRKRIVTYRAGIYRRGERILGNSYEEAIDNLTSNVEYNSEMASLIKEVDKA